MKYYYLKTTVLLSLLMVLFVATSCKKEAAIPEPTKTELLSKTWKIVSIDNQSVLEYLEASEASLTIQATGTLGVAITIDGEVLNNSGTWAWTNNETTLRVLFGNESIDWRIDKLTATDLWFFDTSENATFKLQPS